MKRLRVLAMMGMGLLIGASARAASYTVPTTDPRLSPYANFALLDLQVFRDNGRFHLSYSLPLELTGDQVTLTFTEEKATDGALVLRGEMGKAICSETRCEVDYKHLPINRQAVTARLWEMSQTQEEFDARLQLSMDFEGNPIGIVNLDAPLNAALAKGPFNPRVNDRTRAR